MTATQHMSPSPWRSVVAPGLVGGILLVIPVLAMALMLVALMKA